MGQVKDKMLDDHQDNDLVDFLTQLIKREELSGAIAGIAKQVISQGVRSMSHPQKSAIDSFVESYKKNHECERCLSDNVTDLTDYIAVADQGLCPMCQYDYDQMMKE